MSVLGAPHTSCPLFWGPEDGSATWVDRLLCTQGGHWAPVVEHRAPSRKAGCIWPGAGGQQSELGAYEAGGLPFAYIASWFRK